MATENSGWRKVNTVFQQGETRKKGPWVSVSRWGAVEALVEATGMIIEIAQERGLGRNEFVFDCWANPEKGQVGCIPVPATAAAPGSTAVRWTAGTGSTKCRFHIGGVFKENPDLAPETDVKCMVGKETAPDGKPMLVIAVKAPLSARSSASSGPRASTPV